MSHILTICCKKIDNYYLDLSLFSFISLNTSRYISRESRCFHVLISNTGTVYDSREGRCLHSLIAKYRNGLWFQGRSMPLRFNNKNMNYLWVQEWESRVRVRDFTKTWHTSTNEPPESQIFEDHAYEIATRSSDSGVHNSPAQKTLWTEFPESQYFRTGIFEWELS